MAVFQIDNNNEIYYEYIAPKTKGKTFVFVNALTGSTSAWNGHIGDKVVKEGNGY